MVGSPHPRQWYPPGRSRPINEAFRHQAGQRTRLVIASLIAPTPAFLEPGIVHTLRPQATSELFRYWHHIQTEGRSGDRSRCDAAARWFVIRMVLLKDLFRTPGPESRIQTMKKDLEELQESHRRLVETCESCDLPFSRENCDPCSREYGELSKVIRGLL